MTLIIDNLHVETEGKIILKGVSLRIEDGETVALMGPNGSGKSTLAHAIMGHPDYTITKGKITYAGKDITRMEPEERARLGLFLSFQNPVEIPGLVVKDFLRQAVQANSEERIKNSEFNKRLAEAMTNLGIPLDFASRYLNQGFSGGEKKRMEMLQMTILKPSMAVLDETDSGLDIDALKSITAGINNLKDGKRSTLIITHYRRMLEHIRPDRVLIMLEGKIVREGGPELIDRLEAEGYTWMRESKSA